MLDAEADLALVGEMLEAAVKVGDRAGGDPATAMLGMCAHVIVTISARCKIPPRAVLDILEKALRAMGCDLDTN